jgi:hypothetical protein
MGEVYRARDTRLGREGDTDCLRMERIAGRTLATLPEELFDATDMITELNTRNRDVVTGDGQRFLTVARLGATTVVLDGLDARGKR